MKIIPAYYKTKKQLKESKGEKFIVDNEYENVICNTSKNNYKSNGKIFVIGGSIAHNNGWRAIVTLENDIIIKVENWNIN